MIGIAHIRRAARRFARREDGTTLVEYAICISLFLLILFAIIDFGRLGYNWVTAEKAMQKAVRIAAVRAPVCGGVPSHHVRADSAVGIFPGGTMCRDEPGLCRPVPERACLLSNPSNAFLSERTAEEIWDAVQPLMPNDATQENIELSYQFDEQLGFLGGPYAALVTARLVGGRGGRDDFLFTFVTPLSALAATAGSDAEIPASIPFPDVSVSMPAEDMNIGGRG